MDKTAEIKKCPSIYYRKKMGGRGKPVTGATPERVTKAHDMVMGNRQVTERYIANAVGISQERDHSILMEDLKNSQLIGYPDY